MIRRVGPYELADLLGRGGMGAVFRGRHVVTGALRAVKVLEGATSKTAAARFEREGQALARVRHPGVVVVHEVGVEGTARWLAMDLVEGETLDTTLSRGALEPARAARLIEDVARAIGALHAAGIVHRDLKPANIIVMPDGRPVVLDLGLALAPDADERLTRTGGFAGTLGYLAPEQLRGQASPRTDVHALGLILHELLAGEPAFADQDGPALLTTLMSGDRPDPPKGTPRALADVLRRAHALDPARRHADATALADDLQQARTTGHSASRSTRPRVVAALAATAGAAVAALVAITTSGVSAEPRVTPTATTSEPAPIVTEDPGVALARARRLDGPERRAALDEWLARFPRDARAPATRAQVDVLARQAPRWALTVPGLVAARFLDPTLVVVASNDAFQLLDAVTGAVRLAGRAPVTPAALAPRSPTEWLLLGADGALLRLSLGGGDATYERLPSGRGLTTTPRASNALASSLGTDAWLVPLAGGPNVRLATGDRKVSAVALSPDGATAVTACGATAAGDGLRDYTLLVWDVATARERARVDVLSFPSALAFLADGSFVVGTTVGQLLRVVPADRTFELAATFVRPGATGPTEQAHAGAITSVATDPSGRRLVTAAGSASTVDNEVAIWDVATRRRLWLHDSYTGRPSGVDVAPDGSALLVVEPKSGRLEVWGPLDALGRAP